MKKVIHYLNQFFGGLGGEDTASVGPKLVEGPVGPGLALNNVLEGAEVSYTIICGDNYVAENKDKAFEEIIDLIKDKEFDALVAGPAFQAGRYGFACGGVCMAVKNNLNKMAVTSMHEENPGVEMFRNNLVIFEGGNSAAKMKIDMEKMGEYLNKYFAGKTLGEYKEEGFFRHKVRHQIWLEEPVTAARRGVDMLVKKLYGKEFQTELPIELKERVPIAKPIVDLTKARIALTTTGGIVPVDNPDRIQSASATRWGRYDISNMDDLKAGEFKTIHAGFDPAAADSDPDVIMPVDVMKKMLKEGVYGSLHPYFYSTVGTGTTEAEASRMAKEIIPYLKKDAVDAILMVST